MKHIAYIQSDFPDKFGIPRQSGLVDSLVSRVVFAPEFRNPDALRGIEGFSHLWLIWEFSESVGKPWSPTVRPPRLGGNARLGVFATRSPFRPNPVGLSCVRLVAVEQGKDGPVLVVAGADLMDGTPIYDIKPYIPYADCQPDALGGFTTNASDYLLKVEFPESELQKLPEDRRQTALDLLSHDPRPSYQKDPQRIYGMSFAGKNIRFRVEEETLIVVEVL